MSAPTAKAASTDRPIGRLAAGLAALVVLRDRPSGRRMAIALLTLAACLVVQHRLGAAAADGEGTVWLHVPFGVAMVAVAAQANRTARRLAEPQALPVERTRHG
jgi:peptidoglycan/LPS O-acetylase OafA/YrhL